MIARRRHRLAVFSAAFLLTVGSLGLSAEPARAPGLPRSGPVMEDVAYRFFDDATGERIGRLHIDRIKVEAGRQGFLRVAWRPVAVLEGVTLEVTAAAQWPAAGQQILRSLTASGNHSAVLLRGVVLQLPGRAEIHAAHGRLRAEGALELFEDSAPGKTPSTDAVPNLLFWFAGPNAGQLTRADHATVAANATALPSTRPGSLQP